MRSGLIAVIAFGALSLASIVPQPADAAATEWAVAPATAVDAEIDGDRVGVFGQRSVGTPGQTTPSSSDSENPGTDVQNPAPNGGFSSSTGSPAGSGNTASTGGWSGNGSGSSAGAGSTSASRPIYTRAVCDYTGGNQCLGFSAPGLTVNPLPGNDADTGADASTGDNSGPQIVTIADIATFTPQSPVQYMQPDRWMVVGLPTNFYTDITPHIVSGQLLGQPADVRFTPFAYLWAYGDGTAVTHTTPGGTWQALGLNEFDATPTSHVYTAEGTYTITLTVAYAAEYRYAGGAWTPIAGYLELPANELIAQAASDAVTVLVDRDCTRSPRGPGC